jgi:hypothetical protein
MEAFQAADNSGVTFVINSVSYHFLFFLTITGMRRKTTFRSKTDPICDGGPIRLYYYNIIL